MIRKAVCCMIASDKRARLKSFFLYAALAGLISVLYLWIGCPFRFFLGIPCPGCGITRALFSFVTGHIHEAFHYHPLFLVMPVFALLMMLKNGDVFKNKKLNFVFVSFFVCLIFGVYIFRMIAFFPDTQPMVYNSDAIVNKIILFLKEVEQL